MSVNKVAESVSGQKRRFWQEYIERWSQSGLRQVDYCRANGLATGRFRYWKKQLVVGRKNWMFAGSPAGAHASAAFFTLIETAKANALEPYAYLRYLFDRLPMPSIRKTIAGCFPNMSIRTS